MMILRGKEIDARTRQAVERQPASTSAWAHIVLQSRLCYRSGGSRAGLALYKQLTTTNSRALLYASFLRLR